MHKGFHDHCTRIQAWERATHRDDHVLLPLPVLALLSEFVEPAIERQRFGGTMKTMRATITLLLAAIASILSGIRRAIKRLGEPGTGPFLSGV